MNRTDSIKEFAPAFLAAQMKMKAAPKDASNPYFDSKYSDFASVVAAVKGPLNDNDISYLQPVRLTPEGVEIETVLMHKSGESISETLSIPLNKRDAQAVGSAISYGKRYGLQSICGLPSDDDDGNGAVERPPAERGRQAKATKQEQTPGEDEAFVIKIREAMESRGFQPNEIAASVAAVCNKKKIHLITKLSNADRTAFLQAIGEGRFDRYKGKEAATA